MARRAYADNEEAVKKTCLLILLFGALACEPEKVWFTETTDFTCVLDDNPSTTPPHIESRMVNKSELSASSLNVHHQGKQGYCAKHAAEIVTLEEGTQPVCSTCGDEVGKFTVTKTSKMTRGDLPRRAAPIGDAATTHFRIVNANVGWGPCRSKVCLCTAKNAWDKEICEMVSEHRIRIGFNRDQVRDAWGAPEDNNRTTTAAHQHEQWVYSSGRYVYLDDGVVTAIQD